MRKKILDSFKFKNTKEEKIKSQKRGFIYLTIYAGMLPTMAHADVVNVLQNFFGYLTGDIGKAVAGLAIVGVGYGCFGLGKIPKGYLVAVVLGVGIIFGAKAILSMLTG